MTYLVKNTYQSLNSKHLLGLSILVFIIYFAVRWYQGKPESQSFYMTLECKVSFPIPFRV